MPKDAGRCRKMPKDTERCEKMPIDAPERNTVITLTIPTLRRYDLLRTAVASASQGSLIPTRYHIIDNGGMLPDAVAEDILRIAQQTNATLVLERPGRNLGVAASWNKAMHDLPAGEDFIIVSNDDVTFYRDTIRLLVEASQADREGLFFFPGSGGYKNAWSLYLQRVRSLIDVGWYDETISPSYGFFEDNDYSYRLSLAGYRHIPVAHCAYGHVDSATVKSYTTPEREAHAQRFALSRARYTEKWGGDPGSETYRVPFHGARPDHRTSGYAPLPEIVDTAGIAEDNPQRSEG
jgi:GT2 family glycosyltransferase